MQCVSNQSFADETQIYNFIAPSQIGSIVQNIENCISCVKVCEGQNKLKLNDDKTEVLLIQTKNSFKSCESPSILHVGNEHIPFSESARNLGYVISNIMSLDTHVMSVCRSAYCAICPVGFLRQMPQKPKCVHLFLVDLTTAIPFCQIHLHLSYTSCREFKTVQLDL